MTPQASPSGVISCGVSPTPSSGCYAFHPRARRTSVSRSRVVTDGGQVEGAAGCSLYLAPIWVLGRGGRRAAWDRLSPQALSTHLREADPAVPPPRSTLPLPPYRLASVTRSCVGNVTNRGTPDRKPIPFLTALPPVMVLRVHCLPARYSIFICVCPSLPSSLGPFHCPPPSLVPGFWFLPPSSAAVLRCARVAFPTSALSSGRSPRKSSTSAAAISRIYSSTRLSTTVTQPVGLVLRSHAYAVVRSISVRGTPKRGGAVHPAC